MARRKQQKQPEPTRDELFRRFVGNIGSHCASLHGDAQSRFCMSAVPGLEPVSFEVELKGEHPDVWDRCFHVQADGTREWLGNRHGMVMRYTQLCADALAAWLKEAA